MKAARGVTTSGGSQLLAKSTRMLSGYGLGITQGQPHLWNRQSRHAQTFAGRCMDYGRNAGKRREGGVWDQDCALGISGLLSTLG